MVGYEAAPASPRVPHTTSETFVFAHCFRGGKKNENSGGKNYMFDKIIIAYILLHTFYEPFFAAVPLLLLLQTSNLLR